MRWLLNKVTWHPCMSCINEFSMWKEINHQAEQFEYIKPTLSSLCSLYEWDRGKRGSSQLFTAAMKYNLEALHLFRNSKVDITANNWLAVLTFGIGIMIFHFATADPAIDQQGNFLSVFHLLRGTAKVAIQVEPFFKNSELKAMLSRRRILIKSPFNDGALQAVQRLAAVRHPEGTPDSVRVTCSQAIASLIGWTKAVEGCPRSWLDFILFPAVSWYPYYCCHHG
jgi:hypothetical protein